MDEDMGILLPLWLFLHDESDVGCEMVLVGTLSYDLWLRMPDEVPLFTYMSSKQPWGNVSFILSIQIFRYYNKLVITLLRIK